MSEPIPASQERVVVRRMPLSQGENATESQRDMIRKLPTELLLDIFFRCDCWIKARLNLSHTCQRWRSITLESASLWTSFHIQVQSYHKPHSKTFENFVSLINMQLDRAGSQLLDVFWFGNGVPYCNSRILSLLRQRHVFPSCRTLRVRFDKPEDDTRKESLAHPADVFSNLETLEVNSSSLSPILNGLNSTATSKLQVVDLEPSGLSNKQIIDHYSGALQHTSRLWLPMGGDAFGQMPTLPKNIIHVGAGMRVISSNPHLESCSLRSLLLVPTSSDCLRNLAVLTVADVIEIPKGRRVFFHSLRTLSCVVIFLGAGAGVEAPLLEKLHLGRGKYAHLLAMLNHAGYLLSPVRSLVVDYSLPEATTIRLLERCPDVEQASLAIDLDLWTRMLMEYLLGTVVEDSVQTGRPEMLCPRISDLRLRFYWVAPDIGHWMDMATKLVQKRRACGVDLVTYKRLHGEREDSVLA